MRSLYHMLSYLLAVPGVVVLYMATSLLLLRHSTFFQLCTAERRRYIVSNLVKAAVLSVGAVALTPCWLGMLMTAPCEWPCGALMRLVAPCYVSLDLISLFWVKNHQTSTKFHHIAVVGCGVAVTLWEARVGSIIYHICIFALFSTLAAPANFYLGGRFLVPRGSHLQRMGAGTAATIYIIVYIAHILVHGWGLMYFGGWLYALPILFGVFVLDDIKLMRWLVAEAVDPNLE
jgi:hypothetical protein